MYVHPAAAERQRGQLQKKSRLWWCTNDSRVSPYSTGAATPERTIFAASTTQRISAGPWQRVPQLYVTTPTKFCQPLHMGCWQLRAAILAVCSCLGSYIALPGGAVKGGPRGRSSKTLDGPPGGVIPSLAAAALRRGPLLPAAARRRRNPFTPAAAGRGTPPRRRSTGGAGRRCAPGSQKPPGSGPAAPGQAGAGGRGPRQPGTQAPKPN